MPVAVWREMVEQHFPGCGWIRLPRDTMDALLAYRSRHALPSWEATVEALLDGSAAADPPASDPLPRAHRHHRKDGAVTVTAFAAETEARFALARQVADAVLFEGYVLYPYRASAAKNRLRWQFGVLVPPGLGRRVRGARLPAHRMPDGTEGGRDPLGRGALPARPAAHGAAGPPGRRLRDRARTPPRRPGAGALGRGRRGTRRGGRAGGRTASATASPMPFTPPRPRGDRARPGRGRPDRRPTGPPVRGDQRRRCGCPRANSTAPTGCCG